LENLGQLLPLVLARRPAEEWGEIPSPGTRARHEQELEDAGQNQDGAESYYEVRARQQNEIEEAKKVQKVNRERKADHDSAKQTLLAWLGSLGLTPEQLAEHERQINGEGGAIWDPRSV
jgi:hypothetical protein